MKFSVSAAVALFGFISHASANIQARAHLGIKAVKAGSTTPIAGTFDQLVDHKNPSLGTFKQRYWYSTEYWHGPGSPIVIFNPGEVSAYASSSTNFLGYLANSTLVGQYMQELEGAGIIIEHRYWGTSSPFTDLTVANLKYHTLDNAIQDMIYFAKNVNLAFDTSGGSKPEKAPWVFVGGSYSGALAAWTEIAAPGTFWAYHASSAPVQSIQNFWQYFAPIQAGLPANCSKDLSLVIGHVDSVLSSGTASEVLTLKSLFGLGTVVHNDDFAVILARPLFEWQTSISNFLPYCDAIEGVRSGARTVPDANGVGLTAALANYAASIKSVFGCTSANCYDSRNGASSTYTSTKLDPTVNAGRAWEWMLCTEGFGWWQNGEAPAGTTSETIVSHALTASHWQSQCALYFPGATFSTASDSLNSKYGGGWNLKTQRVMFSNGEFDPWRSASVASNFRPGGPLASTADMPTFIVPGAVHVNDLFADHVTPAIKDVRVKEIAQIKAWVKEFGQNPTSSTTQTSSTTKTSSRTSATTTTTTSTPRTTTSRETSATGSTTKSGTSVKTSSSQKLTTTSTVSTTKGTSTKPSTATTFSSVQLPLPSTTTITTLSGGNSTVTRATNTNSATTTTSRPTTVTGAASKLGNSAGLLGLVGGIMLLL